MIIEKLKQVLGIGQWGKWEKVKPNNPCLEVRFHLVSNKKQNRQLHKFIRKEREASCPCGGSGILPQQNCEDYDLSCHCNNGVYKEGYKICSKCGYEPPF